MEEPQGQEPIPETEPDSPEIFPEVENEGRATADDIGWTNKGDPSKGHKGQKFRTDKPTMAEIKRLKKKNTRKVAILLDSSLSHQIDEKVKQIEDLTRKMSGSRGLASTLADTVPQDLDRLEDELEALEREAEEYTVEFMFQDIGRLAYDELVKENRPTEEEKQEYKDQGGEGVLAYSTTTFPPLLVHKCAIEPTITLNEAKEIFDEWAEGDLELLFTCALLVCKEPTSLPKSRAGTAKTRASRRNSTTQHDLESHTQDS